jgi:D-alanyl-lipoteichoic acid acyltransferase DltB (MBOAT superfamily)
LAVDGLRQFLWGLFKKVIIADNCAIIVNEIFENYSGASASTLALGAILFSFQIYGDFSGYSDMALGIGKLLGLKFLRNFSVPYFSRDIAEFWRRWHISLTTWFRDYLYIPLGGSRGSKWQVVRNTFIIFLVSGFWHGANWTFIVWGAYHAILFLPLILLENNRKHTDTVARERIFPNIKELLQMGITFGLVAFGWIFFRADSMSLAWDYILGIFSSSLFSMPEIIGKQALFFIFLFMIIEWIGRDNQYAIEKLGTSWKRPLFRYAAYYAIIAAIILFAGETQEFIYFQF